MVILQSINYQLRLQNRAGKERLAVAVFTDFAISQQNVIGDLNQRPYQFRP